MFSIRDFFLTGSIVGIFFSVLFITVYLKNIITDALSRTETTPVTSVVSVVATAPSFAKTSLMKHIQVAFFAPRIIESDPFLFGDDADYYDINEELLLSQIGFAYLSFPFVRNTSLLID